MFSVPIKQKCAHCEGMGFLPLTDEGPLITCALCRGSGQRPVPPQCCAALNGQQLLHVAPTFLQLMEMLEAGLAEMVDVVVYRDNRVLAVRQADGCVVWLGTTDTPPQHPAAVA